MELKDIFNSWSENIDQKFSEKQWFLSRWETIDGIEWSVEKIDKMISCIRDDLYLTKDIDIADLGCGGGWITEALKPNVRKIYGLDISLSMLKRATEQDFDCAFVCGQMAQLPYKPQSFSRILSYFVFINIIEDAYIESSILEIMRVLKKEGRALIGQLPDKNQSSLYDKAKIDYRRYCEAHFQIGRDYRELNRPPTKLFDRKNLAKFLEKNNIQYEMRDSFNPFLRTGEPDRISWRFDLILKKP